MLEGDSWDAKITFDGARVFIQFHQEGNPSHARSIRGRICLPVYLAIKQRLLRNTYKIKLLQPNIAKYYCQKVRQPFFYV